VSKKTRGRRAKWNKKTPAVIATPTPVGRHPLDERGQEPRDKKSVGKKESKKKKGEGKIERKGLLPERETAAPIKEDSSSTRKY